jgi:hypothetical protein
MRLYLDDDVCEHYLVALLRKAGHAVTVPNEVGTGGQSDARHLLDALRLGIPLMSRNTRDFTDLHALVTGAGGAHAGVILIYSEADRRRNMRRPEIAAALAKLDAAGLDLTNQRITLNHWR